MQLATVIGNVVSTQKTGQITGLALMVVRLFDADLKPTQKTMAAADTVNCSPGDTVMLCGSSSARMTDKTKESCVDLAIVGIVDSVSPGKQQTGTSGTS